MSGKATRWLKGCGCTLAVLLVVGTLILIGGSAFMMKPFREAIEVRESLDQEYGAQSDYTPPTDGIVHPEQMERFLDVRRELMPMCDRFEDVYDSLQAVEQFDGQDDPPRGEILKAVFETARGAFDLAPALGEFIQARNNALVDHGIGLGEYTYIYSLAYGDRLVSVHEDGEVIRMEVNGSRRLLELLEEMLRRQRDAAETGSPWAGTLEDELRRLDGTVPDVPWSQGLPTAMEASLTPYRIELEQNYCPHTLNVELTVHKTISGGIGITGE